jgi:hypothetical protein
MLIPIVQKGKKFVTFALVSTYGTTMVLHHVHTMWYEEKVSNFKIAVAKLKETL